MNIDEEEMQQPGYMKKLQFEDVIKYIQKTNGRITTTLLLQHGFTPAEINWLYYYKEDEIKEANRMHDNTITKLQEENKALKEEIKQLKTTQNNKQKYEFVKLKSEWVIKTKNNNKKSNNIVKHVPKKNVVNMLKILDLLTNSDNPKTTYRQIIKTIIIQHNIPIDENAFNGGVNRAKYFFPLYYYPIKILQHMGVIDYKPHGNIFRKDFN